MKRLLATLFAVLWILIITPLTAVSQWTENGVLATQSTNTQSVPVAVPDGDGGIYVVWYETQSLTGEDVFAQRFDSRGNRLWGDLGVVVCGATGHQNTLHAASSFSGNLYVSWDDERFIGVNGVYAQKVNPDGVAQWANNGVAVSTNLDDQHDSGIASDGAGGVIIVWEKDTGGIDDVFGQRIDVTGARVWGANGADIVAAGSLFETNPVLIADGTGGAFVAWIDERLGSGDVFAQRLNAAGNPQWATDGIAVTTSADDIQSIILLPDRESGVIVGWYDQGTLDVRIQRLDEFGAPLWGSSGINLDSPASDVDLASDGDSGAIAAWSRGVFDSEIRAQHVSPDGVSRWGSGGVLLSAPTSDHYRPSAVSDGEAGAIVVWRDLTGADVDLRAQRVDANGNPVWGTFGSVIISGTGHQDDASLVTDHNGNALFSFSDDRTGNSRPRAQRIDGVHGYWGHPEPSISSVADTPSDQGGVVDVTWLASDRDKLAHSLITHYSVWRATDALSPSPSPVEHLMASPAEIGPGFSGVAYRSETGAAGDFFWEYIGQSVAIFAPGYSFSAPTKYDSTATNPGVHYFQVVAHTESAFLFWTSNTDSGWSVDNLSPAPPPAAPAAARSGDDVLLSWSPSGADEPDFSSYVVYRRAWPGLEPDPVYLLGETPDTTLLDTTADPNFAYWYIVTTRDIHGNESDPTEETMVSGTSTDAGDTPSLTTLHLAPNVPNPFNASTEIVFGLPEKSDVRLEVFDVLGRRVFARDLEAQAAGWNGVLFDGRNGKGELLPSGVYFCRVKTAGMVETRKMVISR